MRSFFAWTTLFIILFLGVRANGDTLKNTAVRTRQAYDFSNIENKWFSCTVEGRTSNQQQILITSNPFLVEDTDVDPTKHEVITQFYFTAKQANPDLYEQMVRNGGFYADCKVRDGELQAASMKLARFELAMKKNIKVLELQNFQFNPELLKQYRAGIGRYKNQK